jgi:hypothetical protein
MMKGPVMADKSPRQTMSKKSGKSLKEKRADKHTKAARRATSTDALFHDKKRWSTTTFVAHPRRHQNRGEWPDTLISAES